MQPPYHIHFTSSSLSNLGHQVDPLEKRKYGTGSVPDQSCYNTCSKIFQQNHSSCYWPVSTLSCWSKTHFLCMGHPTVTKQSQRNWHRIGLWVEKTQWIYPNYVQHGLPQGLMTHDTDSLNGSVSLILIPSRHTESFSGEVEQTTESISMHQKIIRIMAYTKTKSSVRNYVDVQYTATYQQKLSLLPSVVESMENMEKKFH